MAHLQLNSILRKKAKSVSGPKYKYGGGTYTKKGYGNSRSRRIDELLHQGALRGPSGTSMGSFPSEVLTRTKITFLDESLLFPKEKGEVFYSEGQARRQNQKLPQLETLGFVS